MSITYRQLMDLGHEFAGLDSHGYKNYVKELKRYLKRRNISPYETVPDDFIDEVFSDAENILPRLFSGSSLRSRQSFLRRWASIWRDWVTGKALPTRFDQALQTLMDLTGVTQKQLADYLGVDPSTVRGYQKGRHKPVRSVLKGIEGHFGLEPGTLGARVGNRNGPINNPLVPLTMFPEELQRRDSVSSQVRTEVRKQLPEDFFTLSVAEQKGMIAELSADRIWSRDYFKTMRRRFHLPLDAWSVENRMHAANLTEYMSGTADEYGELELIKFESDEDVVPPRKRKWSSPRTRTINIGHIERFFGLAMMSEEEVDDIYQLYFKNLERQAETEAEKAKVRMRAANVPARTLVGLSESEVNFALLIDARAWHDLVRFQRTRGGAYNGSSEKILAFATSLVQDKVGWLRSKPQLISLLDKEHLASLQRVYSITGEHAPRDLWERLCDGCLRHLRGYGTTVRTIKKRIGRSALEPFMAILDLPRPEIVLDKLKVAAKRDLEQLMKPSTRFHYFTDLLIAMLLQETALRREHFETMTYRLDNTGHLRRVGNRFYLDIPIRDFKNWDGAVFKDLSENATIRFNLDDPELQEALATYVDQVRPMLLKGNRHDFLFPTYTTGKPPRPHYIYSRYVGYTRRYLPMTGLPQDVLEIGQFGPHVVRYIIGTTCAKAGSLADAADALLDTIEMVTKRYQHFKPTQRHERAAARRRGWRVEYGSSKPD